MTSEIQENVDASINLKMLKELENSIEEVCDYKFVDYNKLPKNAIKQYVQISMCFSKYFPKVSDESLFEIDDLLYKNEELHADINYGVPLEAPRVLVNNCIRRYIYISLHLISYTRMPPSRILENAFLQVIQCSKNKHYKKFPRMFMEAVNTLLQSRNAMRICLSLKMLKVILGNQHVNLFDDIYNYHEDAIYWMRTCLPNIPHSSDPDQKRITSWMSQQSSLINKTLQINPSLIRDRTKNFLEKYDKHREFDARFVNRLRYDARHFETVIYDHLYLFFTSAKTDEEKRKRLNDFLEGAACGNLDALEESGSGDEIYKVRRTEAVIRRCSDLILTSRCTFKDIFDGMIYSDDVLRKMEDRFGFEVKPYLGGDSNQVDEDSKGHLKCEGICSSMKDENEDHEYFIEKYLFYDGFVKKLNVFNILHTACMMCQELLQTSGEFAECDSFLFRSIHYIPMMFIREAILKPSKRGYIPWLVEILIKKCPFMILPKRYEFLMEDLIKLLKGEQIDELVEEKIFLAVSPET